jgi:DNA-directed RNA polymerase specialized sigma24 family protein
MNFEKMYKYARSIAGVHGEDLFHHVYLKCQNKQIQHSDSYYFTAMRNEWMDKRSEFHKQYRQVHLDIENYDKEAPQEDISKFDSITLQTVLLSLEIEGYELQVKTFKECYFFGSKRSFSKKTGIDIRTIDKICNFVIQEIKKRYDTSDN